MKQRQYKTTPKFRGYLFEREVKKKLEDLGFFVFRSTGSFKVDLIAFSPKGNVYWIECKLHRDLPQKEKQRWEEIAETYHAHFVVVNRFNLKQFLFLLKSNEGM
jgi:Holliday junction resolvase